MAYLGISSHVITFSQH